MGEPRWKVVADELDVSSSGPTAEQVALAAQVGVDLAPLTPAPMAAYLLRDPFRAPLELPTDKPANNGGYDYLQDLRNELGEPHDEEEVLTAERLTAEIRVLRDRRSASHLRRLQPNVGDIITMYARSNTLVGEVSSIGDDGAIYFRGGLGRRGRPHQAQIVARVGDPSYDEERRAVQNAVAAMRNDDGLGRLDQLTKWRVKSGSDYEDLAAFEDGLAAAVHEDTLQTLLEQHPQLLKHLVPGNHGAFVIPRPNLGGKVIPDFLIAGATSIGITWLLVELESPSAPLVIGDGQFAQQPRKGIHQIQQWRESLSNNLHVARMPTAQGGYGLPGIRADAPGLVVVSRETETLGSKQARE
jgi:hypothetical protein